MYLFCSAIASELSVTSDVALLHAVFSVEVVLVLQSVVSAFLRPSVFF